MFCSNCGKEVEDGMRFCTSCGTPVGEITSGKAEPQKKINKLFLSAIIVAPVILIIWSTTLFINGYIGKKEIDNSPHIIIEKIIKMSPGVSTEDRARVLDTIYRSYEDDMRNAGILLVVGLVSLSISIIYIVQGQKPSKKNMAIAGLVLSIIGLVATTIISATGAFQGL
jgi:hypothetical protein